MLHFQMHHDIARDESSVTVAILAIYAKYGWNCYFNNSKKNGTLKLR